MAAEGFFRRWASRKAESNRAAARPERGREGTRGDDAGQDGTGVAGEASAVQRPPPTLDDVRQLTRESDYSPFVARGVDTAVRRAALKTLFSDPHFNLMDGLDIYIGDYTKHAPLTPAMLAALRHTRSLTEAAARLENKADAQDELPTQARQGGEPDMPVAEEPLPDESLAQEEADMNADAHVGLPAGTGEHRSPHGDEADGESGDERRRGQSDDASSPPSGAHEG